MGGWETQEPGVGSQGALSRLLREPLPLLPLAQPGLAGQEQEREGSALGGPQGMGEDQLLGKHGPRLPDKLRAVRRGVGGMGRGFQGFPKGQSSEATGPPSSTWTQELVPGGSPLRRLLDCSSHFSLLSQTPVSVQPHPSAQLPTVPRPVSPAAQTLHIDPLGLSQNTCQWAFAYSRHLIKPAG